MEKEEGNIMGFLNFLRGHFHGMCRVDSCHSSHDRSDLYILDRAIGNSGSQDGGGAKDNQIDLVVKTDRVHLKNFFEIIRGSNRSIGKFLKEVHIEVTEVGLVQVLHVLTQDVSLDLSGDLDCAHRAPDLLSRPHGGNLLTIQLGIILIPVAQNFLLEVKLLRGSSKGVGGGNSLLLVTEEAVCHDITPCDSVNLTIDLKILHFDLSEGEVTNGGLVVGQKDQIRGKIIETIDCTSMYDVLVNSDPAEGLSTGDNIGFGFVENIIKGPKVMSTKKPSYFQIIFDVNTGKIVGSGLETIPGFLCSGHMVIGDGANIISSEKITVKMKICVGMIF